jgi:hypothetical protein
MINIQTISDERGNLTVIEKLPFDIKRVYYLHGVPEGAERGGHKHKITERVIVAISGGFDVEIGDYKLHMNSPSFGLFVPKMTYLKLSNFTPGAICLALASTEHDEADCIR